MHPDFSPLCLQCDTAVLRLAGLARDRTISHGKCTGPGLTGEAFNVAGHGSFGAGSTGTHIFRIKG